MTLFGLNFIVVSQIWMKKKDFTFIEDLTDPDPEMFCTEYILSDKSLTHTESTSSQSDAASQNEKCRQKMMDLDSGKKWLGKTRVDSYL